MDDLAREIRRRVRAAVEGMADAVDAAGDEKDIEGNTNIAAAINLGGEGHTVTVQSDDEKTVIVRDGVRRVIHHRPTDAS